MRLGVQPLAARGVDRVDAGLEAREVFVERKCGRQDGNRDGVAANAYRSSRTGMNPAHLSRFASR